MNLLVMILSSISVYAETAPKFICEPVVIKCVQEGTTTLNSYFIRPDGGTLLQCNGKKDAPYTVGSTECAWKNPMIALPKTAPILKAGDSLIIKKGNYKIGLGQEGALGCSSAFPWDCTVGSIPNGVKILGEGYDTGCASPPKLSGVERTSFVLNLKNSNDVEVQCLEITDNLACVEHHCHNGTCTGIKAPCKRDVYPYGEWSAIGIVGSDSRNVLIKNVNIHGLASRGVQAARIENWTIENSKINGNGWSGWEGDLGATTSSNKGYIKFLNTEIAWNGCVQGLDGNAFGCWAQSTGGYGDGLGTNKTGGNWIFDNVNIHHNTSDGLDLLYTDNTGSIEIKNSKFEFNAGNQVKSNGKAILQNNTINGTCSYFSTGHNFKPEDNCRAQGNAISVGVSTSEVTIQANTVKSEGDCLLLASGGTSTGKLIVKSNIMTGLKDWRQPTEQSCAFWSEGVEQRAFNLNKFINTKETFKDLVCTGDNQCLTQ